MILMPGFLPMKNDLQISSVFHILVLIVITTVIVPSNPEKVCPRDKSRVVAGVVRQKIFRVFNSLRLELSSTCKFSLERDMYGAQEDHKVLENPSRWTCNFCGKAFISEYFLDKHFDNRHADFVKVDDALCLADVCDVFRCDILSGVAQPDYWDIALCLEDDMLELTKQCQALVEECIPTGIGINETNSLRDHMVESVCSSLTCSRYWDRPYEGESSTHLALYIVLSTMTVFGIIIYNFVFYNYFYSDFGETGYDPTPRRKHHMKKYGTYSESRIHSRPSRHRGQYMEQPSSS